MKVLIAGQDRLIKVMYESQGFNVVNDIKDATFVQFIGGADVSPSLYNEVLHPFTSCSIWTDERDKAYLYEAIERSLPCVGICRGGQFLNVMAGGRLWQHVNGHAVSNGHQATDTRTGRSFHVTSTHHQMIRPTSQGVVLATANEATRKEHMKDGKVEAVIGDGKDVEAVWYPKWKFLCYQPHPEYDSKECREYFFSLIEEFI